ncbi:MAG: 2-dehydropantoate 2-reductase N-terminal domain-containing protein [Turneriella sp.]
MPTSQKIAFLGTGAIGASLVRALYLNQVPFTILVRDKKRKADLLAQGIKYRLRNLTEVKLGGEYAVRTIAEAEKYDYVFLGMKTPHLKTAGKTAKKLLEKDGRVMFCCKTDFEGYITGLKEEQIVSGIVGYNTQVCPMAAIFSQTPAT